MTSFRVGRNKAGDRVSVQIENERGVMVGFLLTDDEARALAGEVLARVRPTATELTADKHTEP